MSILVESQSVIYLKSKHKNATFSYKQYVYRHNYNRSSFSGEAWAFDKSVVGTVGIGLVPTVSYFACTYNLKSLPNQFSSHSNFSAYIKL